MFMERHRTATTELPYFISGNARIFLLDNGVLYVRWQPFSVITAEDAQNVAASVFSYLPSENRRVLFELAATTLTPEARRILREAKGSCHLYSLRTQAAEQGRACNRKCRTS